MKELKRVIKYVIDTKDYGLKLHIKQINLNGLLQIVLYSDSDWAGDTESRISVTGYVIFFQGCIVSWKSKAQSCVTLSSSEAELMALSEATKEIRFIYELLKAMDIKVQLPIICRVDNVGAIFMAENVTATPKSKHMDTRAKFVTQFIADGFLKIIFVKTSENTSDPFTKNVSGEVHEKHKVEYVWKGNEVACLGYSAQQEGCCEVLIEDTKTTQNRETSSGKMKGKVLQRKIGYPGQEVWKNQDYEGQESSRVVCEKAEMSVGNSYLDVDNWDFLNRELDQPGTSRD
jgi:hypothetical protein